MKDDPIQKAQALIASGQAAQAARSLRARITMGRGGLLARTVLVKALIAAGRLPDALAAAREAVTLNPMAAVAVLTLGEALLAAEFLPAAIAELQRALRIDPALDIARLRLAQAWLKAGEATRALEILAGLEPSPDVRMLEQMAQAIQKAPRSDAGYIRHLFDQFAGTFDSHMVGHLGYAGPQILLELVRMVMPLPAGRKTLSVLDLGCGTGLAGVAFRPLAARLDGIDLSPLMIEKARARKLYHHLAVADLETALAMPQTCPDLAPVYDLIVAADTLVYLGDLSGVLIAAAARLSQNGFILFTAEAGPDDGYELGPKRRWRHGRSYLRGVAGAAGLTVAGLLDAATRYEAGQPVEGYAVALCR